MKFKTLAFFVCLFGAVVLACSCGGGGGGGKGGNEHSQTVAVGLSIKSIDGNIDKSSSNGGRDLIEVLQGAKYYYTAVAAWDGDDAQTALGTQLAEKEFVPGVTKFFFASGDWRIDVTVKSENGGQLYTTKRDQDNKVPKTNINVATKFISVILEKNLGGLGEIGLDIFIPPTGNGDAIVVKYTPIDGGDTIVLGPYTEENGGLVPVTDPNDPNVGTLECHYDIDDVPAGIYTVVIEYLTDDPDPQGQDPDKKTDPDYPGKIVSGGGVETVNVFGGEDSDIDITITPTEWEGAVFTIEGIYVIGATISCDIPAVDNYTVPAGTSVRFTATPKTGAAIVGTDWIEYITPNAYKWYVDGVEVPGATGATFDYTASGCGYKTVGCCVSYVNGTKTEYAASPYLIVSVTPAP